MRLVGDHWKREAVEVVQLQIPPSLKPQAQILQLLYLELPVETWQGLLQQKLF